jgi:hypothetical protein
MDNDRIAGSAKEWAGKAEGALGDAVGDADTPGSRACARCSGHGAKSLWPSIKTWPVTLPMPQPAMQEAMARKRW